MAEFFHMDGYAGFIWPAYAVSVVLMAGLWLMSQRALKRSQEALDGMERIRPEAPGAGRELTP